MITEILRRVGGFFFYYGRLFPYSLCSVVALLSRCAVFGLIVFNYKIIISNLLVVVVALDYFLASHFVAKIFVLIEKGRRKGVLNKV